MRRPATRHLAVATIALLAFSADCSAGEAPEVFDTGDSDDTAAASTDGTDSDGDGTNPYAESDQAAWETVNPGCDDQATHGMDCPALSHRVTSDTRELKLETSLPEGFNPDTGNWFVNVEFPPVEGQDVTMFCGAQFDGGEPIGGSGTCRGLDPEGQTEFAVDIPVEYFDTDSFSVHVTVGVLHRLVGGMVLETRVGDGPVLHVAPEGEIGTSSSNAFKLEPIIGIGFGPPDPETPSGWSHHARLRSASFTVWFK